MAHEVGEEEIAILIKPLGDGRIETCIYKAPDNSLGDESLELALDVALTMTALFEIALDDESTFMEDVKLSVEEKIKEIMDDMNDDDEEEAGPSYTSEGNVLKINRFTKTEGSC